MPISTVSDRRRGHHHLAAAAAAGCVLRRCSPRCGSDSERIASSVDSPNPAGPCTTIKRALAASGGRNTRGSASEPGWSAASSPACDSCWSTVSLQMVLVQQDVPRRERPGQTIRLSRGPAATVRMSGCAGLPSQLGPGFPFLRRLDSGSGDRSSGWVRRGLSGAIPLVSWLTVGPGAGLGDPGIRRGVVAVRCPACAAEQRLEGQQDHASHRHPDTSSGQDVQGIVHP